MLRRLPPSFPRCFEPKIGYKVLLNKFPPTRVFFFFTVTHTSFCGFRLIKLGCNGGAKKWLFASNLRVVLRCCDRVTLDTPCLAAITALREPWPSNCTWPLLGYSSMGFLYISVLTLTSDNIDGRSRRTLGPSDISDLRSWKLWGAIFLLLQHCLSS
ncbi:uncharacterized protein EV420DRAFT_538096 [Desarmillaria tabescens]|uniref:Uncharacterized protein n=1 Tax=Armillaria tabescens TaxID=1929756 RepID=A0AA39K9N9_ARMTA|nr:uncharacterized protein EV420DRAFT_538096 [Desarmillaria tabescens]KAK0457060.1 hypothetical protein EV420DRAFT_538096 [Desarmillaria tabescens]